MTVLGLRRGGSGKKASERRAEASSSVAFRRASRS